MTKGRAYLIERLRKTGLSKKASIEIIEALFKAMAEALQRGEVVDLPFGTLEVKKYKRTPKRGWHLNQISTVYKNPYTITIKDGTKWQHIQASKAAVRTRTVD